MRSLLRKCVECQTYTLEDSCSCGGKTKNPIPPRFSPTDRLGKYRRLMKSTQQERNI